MAKKLKQSFWARLFGSRGILNAAGLQNDQEIGKALRPTRVRQSDTPKEPAASPENASQQSFLMPSATPERVGASPEETAVATASASVPADPAKMRAAEDGVSLDWKVGDVILDLYEVKGILGEGGMGKVYCVHHKGWDTDLAVKSPRPQMLSQPGATENFEREAETWVNLGLHMHIVSCYYVRRLGGIPRVFAEFVAGGSLKDWIDRGELYQGGSDKALERILDIAIQFAWGLHYAHECQLIHQDVKPANVMITPNGTVKVTDFGLAKACAVAGETPWDKRQVSLFVSFGGMTQAYCSPEQADRQPLSRQTDIWSWAVSVLEMFTGEVTWPSGAVAGAALESYVESGSGNDRMPMMPPPLVDLLRSCFRRDLQQRPRDMRELSAALAAIYGEVTGQAYHRLESQAATALADSLNNRAVSMLDLGKSEQAEALWAEALQVDRRHPQSIYNQGIARWRAVAQTDESLVKLVEQSCRAESHRWEWHYILGLIHLERLDAEAAVKALEQAAQRGGGSEVETSLARAISLVPESARFALSDYDDRGVLVDAQTCSLAAHPVHSVRTMQGHNSRVSSVAVSSDGRWAYSGSHDYTVRVWDMTTGQCSRAIRGHTGYVQWVLPSADNRWLLSSDGMARLWDLATGRCVQTLEGHTAFDLSADGRWALSGFRDQTVRLWELTTGRCIQTFEGHTGSIRGVSLSSDGRWVLSASYDKTIRLWEKDTGKCLGVVTWDTDRVESLALSRDARWAVPVGKDKVLRLLEVATGRCVRTFQGHRDKVMSVALTADGRWAFSGGLDGRTRLWELATGRCVRTEWCPTYVTSVAISPDGRWAIAGDDYSQVIVWDFTTLCRTGPTRSASLFCRATATEHALEEADRYRNDLAGADAALDSGCLVEALTRARAARERPGRSRDEQALELWGRLAQCCRRTRLRGVWGERTLEGHLEYNVNALKGGVKAAALSGDGQWVISTDDEALRLWEVATGRCVRVVKEEDPDKKVGEAGYLISPNGLVALLGGERMRLWDLATCQCVREFQESGSPIGWSADGRWTLCEHQSGLGLWDMAAGCRVRSFPFSTARGVNRAALSADGRWILSTKGFELRLWETATGRCTRVLEGHEDKVECVALSADSRLAFSGDHDGYLRLWDVQTGCCLRVCEGRNGWMTSVALSADGRWGLSSSGDHPTRLWEVATGRCQGLLEGHGGGAWSVAFSANGCQALTVGMCDTTVQVWHLDWELDAPEPDDWDDGAGPYLEIFLTQQTPYLGCLPTDRQPSEDEITLALTRSGRPVWTDEDFRRLLHTLGCAGYGWLRPEGVRQKLEETAADWQGPPSLPRQD